MTLKACVCTRISLALCLERCPQGRDIATESCTKGEDKTHQDADENDDPGDQIPNVKDQRITECMGYHGISWMHISSYFMDVHGIEGTPGHSSIRLPIHQSIYSSI